MRLCDQEQAVLGWGFSDAGSEGRPVFGFSIAQVTGSLMVKALDYWRIPLGSL
jgi:hypothetical protein